MLPNKLEYRNYKQFEAHSFLQDDGQLPKILVMRNGKKNLVKIFNKHAPLKTKVIRGNHKSFITKIWERQLWNDQLCETGQISQIIIKLYQKQRNYVVNLSKKVQT